MSALDASFWDLETDTIALHIGAVAVFEGPTPSPQQVAERYSVCVERIDRYRQRMRRVPFGLARPVWVFDEHVDLSYRLRRTSLPSPGGQEQLLTLVGRIMTQPLDGSRPLWEAWVVEGLADGRWALVTKLHHSMIDGVGGLTMLTALFDGDDGAPAEWPHRTSYDVSASPARLVVDALGERAATGVRAIRTIMSLPRHPRVAATELAVLGRGLPRYLSLLRPSRATSLTGSIGRPRRYRTLSADLADVATAREVFGGSVNDVVLLMVTRGLRELLLHRHEAPERHTVRCLVPVNVRAVGQERESTNRVSALVADLPVEFGAIDACYGAVRMRMDRLKHSAEAPAGELAVALAEAVPALLLSAGIKLVEHAPHRMITTVATNVPGPPRRQSMLGCRMVALFPYVPIADVLRVGIAVSSYDGHLHFGITCDRDSVPDADVLVAGMSTGLTELVKAAAEVRHDDVGARR